MVAVLVGLTTFALWVSGQEMSPRMGVYVLAGRAGCILNRPEMVEIRPGASDLFPKDFLMGSPAYEWDPVPELSNLEKPQHRVILKRPFAIGKYEVTFDQYELFARLTGRVIPAEQGFGRGRRPVS